MHHPLLLLEPLSASLVGCFCIFRPPAIWPSGLPSLLEPCYSPVHLVPLPPPRSPNQPKKHLIACGRTQGNIQNWFGSAAVQQNMHEL